MSSLSQGIHNAVCIGIIFTGKHQSFNRPLPKVTILWEITENEKMVPKNKPCKRNNRQISDNTKIAAKQGNAEERPDAGCEIKRWKAAAEMSSFFNIPPDISKADKPQEFEGGTLISR